MASSISNPTLAASLATVDKAISEIPAVAVPQASKANEASELASPAAMGPPVTWSAAKSWSDFGQQLQTITERARYARSAGDKRLAKEVAAQLQACAHSWYSQLQQCLDEEAGALKGELLGDGADTTSLEMCLAQLKTTLANIESLDWTAPVGKRSANPIPVNFTGRGRRGGERGPVSSAEKREPTLADATMRQARARQARPPVSSAGRPGCSSGKPGDRCRPAPLRRSASKDERLRRRNGRSPRIVV